MLGFAPLASQSLGTVPDTTIPVMLGSIALSAITTTGAHAAWSAASDNVEVAGYEVSCDTGTVAWLDVGNVLAVDILGKTASTTYTVSVRAYDAAGNKSDSITAQLVTAGAQVLNSYGLPVLSKADPFIVADVKRITDEQAASGNYPKDQYALYGLRIAIESPRGTVRNWKAADGTSGSHVMTYAYGYIGGTLGNDGDEMDCFIGPTPLNAEVAYVVNQFIDGRFDEHKIMFGFANQQEAEAGYLSAYSEGWTGLGSCIQCSIPQLKSWIASGNKAVPLDQNQLPKEGATMEKVLWDSSNNPMHANLEQVLYGLRAHDGDDGLLFDAVSMTDILADSDGVLALDALVIPFARIEQRMTLLQKVLDRTGGDVKVAAMQVSDPFTQRGTTNVAVIYELTDGQTVSVFFHNPDVTPKKIAPGDDLISWKWMLNKKDITVAVAPEKGRDLDVRTVAARIMRLADKNSARFTAANGKRAEKMEAIASLKAELETKEATLADLEKQVADARAEREVAGLDDPVDPLPDPQPVLTLRSEIERQLPQGYTLASGDDKSAVISIEGGYTATLEIRTPEGVDFTRLYANVSDGSKVEDAGSVPRPEEKMEKAVRYSLESIADVVAVLEREDRPTAVKLTDAEMVVLIAAVSFKSFARLQNAMSDAGISASEYNDALAGLNATGKYLKRSAITAEGKAVVEAFRPDLGPGNANKLKAFKGKFKAEDEDEFDVQPEPEPQPQPDPAAEQAARDAEAAAQAQHDAESAAAAEKATKEAQEAQESADGDFLALAAAGNVDFYDKAVTDRLAALAKQYTDPTGAYLDLIMQAKTAAKNFFVAEFKKKVA